MFGKHNPINSQINMYVFSRVVFGIARTLYKQHIISYKKWGFPLFASLTWAFVMYLFKFQPGTLNQSLINSMTFLYDDSEV